MLPMRRSATSLDAGGFFDSAAATVDEMDDESARINHRSQNERSNNLGGIYAWRPANDETIL